MKRNVIIVLISVLLLTCLFAFARTTTTNLGLVKPTWEEEVEHDILVDLNANSDILDAIFDDVTLTEFAYLDGVTSLLQVQLDNKQTLDAGLLSIAGLTTSANKSIYTTSLDTYAVYTLTAFARTILDDSAAGDVRTTIGLGNVENTKLSTWAGSTAITILGTIATGTWAGTAIADGYIPNTITIDLATLATTLTVSNNESTSETNAILFTSGGVESGNLNIETDGGDFHYNPNTGTLTTTVLTVSGAIATATNISMTGKLDMTGVNAVIELTPAQRGTVQVINITPSATLNTNEAVWDGIFIDGNALHPSGSDVSVYGIRLDFGTFTPTGNGAATVHVDGLKVTMPNLNEHAIHIVDGKIRINVEIPSTPIARFSSIDISYDVDAMVGTSGMHAIDVAIDEGEPDGNIVALGTHTYVDVIHQIIGTFESPDQEGIDSFAGIDDGGDYIDGIDNLAMFNTNGDGFWIGDGDMFDELEVDMSTNATKDVEPTFWYWKTDDWEQFYPADDTEGFQHSGLIRWISGDLTGWSSGDPALGEGETGYWIKVTRTGVANPGTPTAETIKTGAITLYSWDKSGDLSIKDIDAASLILDTPLTDGQGGTGLSSLGTNVATFLGTPSSANLKSAVTGETGSGALVFANTPTLVTPELGAATATSINFGDTTLDYYKEGEWTPAFKFGGNDNNMTYTTQVGLYTKIGRQVTVTCYVLLSAKGDSTGTATLTGLPFTSKNADAAYSAVSMRINVITYASVFQGYIAKNGTTVSLQEVSEAGGVSNLDNTNFDNTSSIYLSATYFTD